MNTEKIKQLADKMRDRQAARSWLEKHGLQLKNGSREQGQCMVRLTMYHAGEESGCTEAVRLLEAYMLVNLPDLVNQAIQCCNNDIDIHRNQILVELDEDAPI